MYHTNFHSAKHQSTSYVTRPGILLETNWLRKVLDIMMLMMKVLLLLLLLLRCDAMVVIGW